jgi:1,4-alpha-glucan branching enzyme
MTGSGARAVGMGAMPDGEKTAFRVWAPHARKVAVVGAFNGWDGGRDPMEAEGDGCWYAEVAGARPGHEYRYLLETPDGALARIDPYAREVTDSAGNGVIHDPAAFDWGPGEFRMPPRDGLVIYELHIGTFHDKGREDGRPGTFHTAIEQLDHLGKLGVNAIEIMPVVEFPGSRSWGYAPAHIFAVESSYGGPSALKALIRGCHRRGIAVILDVVYNHLGPKDVDLWRFDGWSENDLGGIYFFNDWRAETPWGHSRPDYTREPVRRFIVDNALMWLDEYRVDGLRVDGTVFIRTADWSGDKPIPEGYSLLQQINAEVRRRFPGRLLIAEDLRDNPEMTRPVEAGGAGFDTQWDGKFAYEIRRSVITPVDEERSIRCVAEAIAAKYNDDAFQRVIYSESHDEVANGKARVPYEINKEDATCWYSQKRSTLAAALVFTAPGIPMLFQGQEFLEGEWFREDVPLDWDLSDEFRGIVRLYRDLIALRLDRRGVTRGLRGQGIRVHRVDDERKVLAFRRWDRGGPGDDVVVVANFRHEPQHDYAIGFPAEGLWRVRFDSDRSGYSGRFEGREGGDVAAGPGECDGLPYRGAISIPPYTALILSRDPN